MFKFCRNITSMTIPDSVTSIGTDAFRDCFNLVSMTIPDGVTSIGDCAFRDCSNLVSINIPDGVTNIGGDAFSECRKLQFGHLIIPIGVTILKSAAFYNCKINEVTIHSGVTKIEEWALSTTSLNTINYRGTSTDWGNIVLENHWHANSSVNTVHCIGDNVDVPI
jgi:hypothetical protein